MAYPFHGWNISHRPTLPRCVFCSSFWGKKKEVKKVGRMDEQAVYAASRYVCGLKDLIEQLVEDKLSVEKYPSVMPMPTK